jgi:hypothetical protein
VRVEEEVKAKVEQEEAEEGGEGWFLGISNFCWFCCSFIHFPLKNLRIVSLNVVLTEGAENDFRNPNDQIIVPSPATADESKVHETICRDIFHLYPDCMV